VKLTCRKIGAIRHFSAQGINIHRRATPDIAGNQGGVMNFDVAEDGPSAAGKGQRMPLVLDTFRNALVALRAVQAKSEDAAFMATLDTVAREAIRSSVIQHFEFTFELAWKFMRRRLEADIGRSSVDGMPGRDLFRIAAENGLIDDVEAWFRQTWGISLRLSPRRGQTTGLAPPSMLIAVPVVNPA
jgi:nucleotidyltransferase substrate binding protein (TIGR01987 family)